ncbi:MAG: formimidoylglutamate deiminase [Bacteriovoracales bacterium]
MKWWFFQNIYFKGKWIGPTFLKVDGLGKILRHQKTHPEEKFETVNGYLIPGFRNAHSHAFQYMMAGLTEYLAKAGDDFWSWRNLMYDFANKISPEQLEDIAAMAYAEMLRMGFTSVAEFHYLHHDKNGKPFENISEMSARILRGAKKAGINITLIPVFYQRADFGLEAFKAQRRFLCKNSETYLHLLESVEKEVKRDPLFSLGVGIHSLRAVAKEDVKFVLKNTSRKLAAHIHIAEQEKEVRTCLEYYKKRPVQWLLKNIDLNSRYNLVHATHMTQNETIELAKTGANVVICPSTEGNLGDGFFNFLDFHHFNGSFSIGTDGHFNLNPLEELRLLDYGQRLKYRMRNLACKRMSHESGDVLFKKTLKAGILAMGTDKITPLGPGTFFDGVILDPKHPVLFGLKPKKILSGLIFSADPSVFLGTIVRGKWVVKNGCHAKYSDIFKRYSKVKLEIIK